MRKSYGKNFDPGKVDISSNDEKNYLTIMKIIKKILKANTLFTPSET